MPNSFEDILRKLFSVESKEDIDMPEPSTIAAKATDEGIKKFILRFTKTGTAEESKLAAVFNEHGVRYEIDFRKRGSNIQDYGTLYVFVTRFGIVDDNGNKNVGYTPVDCHIACAVATCLAASYDDHLEFVRTIDAEKLLSEPTVANKNSPWFSRDA